MNEQQVIRATRGLSYSHGRRVRRGTLRRAMALSLILIAPGCAMRPTAYVAADHWPRVYGYSESFEGGDDYSLLFKANSATSDQRLAQLVMLRAAYLTLEKGGDGFILIHSREMTQPFGRTAAIPLRGGLIIPVSVGTDENKLAAIVIHVVRPGTTPSVPESIDAQRVVTELSATFER